MNNLKISTRLIILIALLSALIGRSFEQVEQGTVLVDLQALTAR